MKLVRDIVWLAIFATLMFAVYSGAKAFAYWLIPESPQPQAELRLYQ